MTFRFPISFRLTFVLIIFLIGCSMPANKTLSKDDPGPVTTISTDSNPFFEESKHYLKYPQFDQIKDDHYAPAFEQGMSEHRAEIVTITNQSETPTMENTIIAMERSGQLLNRVSAVFFNLISANTNDTMEKIRSEMAPKLSAHNDQIFLNAKLFESISTPSPPSVRPWGG